MALPGIPIPETQCIGDSLDTINSAFSDLDTRVTNAIPCRLGENSCTITNWNDAITNGWYMGSDATNAPGAGWYMGYVQAHNAGWTTQIIHQFAGNNSTWIREQNNSVWGSWTPYGGASVTVSDTPPSGASAGDLWFDSSSGVTSVYYDGTWIDVGGGDSGTSAGSVNGIVQCDGNGNFSAAPNLLTLINELSTNMQNIGNYPYLEYAYKLAPNSFGQTIGENTLVTLTLNSEIHDTHNNGTLASNIITLQPGTYQYKIFVPITCWMGGVPGQGGKSILYLKNNSTGNIISSKIGSDGPLSEYFTITYNELEGQFTIVSATQINVQLQIPTFDSSATVYVGSQFYNDNNPGFTDTDANNAQATTIKLWKVG
jgi:hypothetical protein